MKINKKNWKIVAVCSVLIACFFAFSMLAFAEPAADASGAAHAVWSFNDVISTIVQAVGALVSLVSIVFLAASIAGHDTSQRVSAGLGLAAGLLIAFAPTILSSIGIGK